MFNLKSSLTIAIILLIFIAGTQVNAGSMNSTNGAETLSAVETTFLLFMREEEKMARDVYLTFYCPPPYNSTVSKWKIG